VSIIRGSEWTPQGVHFRQSKNPLRCGVKPLKKLILLTIVLYISGCTTLKVVSYEGVGRDRWQKPDKVIRALDIGPGDDVADIGSGSGYFTLPLAEAVAPHGTVFASDIDENINNYLKRRLRRSEIRNVEVIQADPYDPNLPTEVGLVFMCNTYHYIEDAETYFSHIRGYLRRDGRIALIDFDGSRWRHRLSGHYSDRDSTVRTLKAAGYRLDEEFHFLDRQYFLVFSTENY